jgi:EPS-associated MarR family transcriptional regulator
MLGISLGKTNYCLKALIHKGFIKARNFQRNPNKLGYVYLMTPKGLQAKIRITKAFLERKRDEFEALQEEIRLLSDEVMQSEKAANEK